MAFLMLSAGILASRASSIALRRRGLESGFPPPILEAIVISRIILVKSLPRLASAMPFLCLIPAHLECPDMVVILADLYFTQLNVNSTWAFRRFFPFSQNKP